MSIAQNLAELDMHSLAGCADAVDTAAVAAERALKDQNYAEAIDYLTVAKEYAQKVLTRSEWMIEKIKKLETASRQ